MDERETTLLGPLPFCCIQYEVFFANDELPSMSVAFNESVVFELDSNIGTDHTYKLPFDISRSHSMVCTAQ